ncbi:MAG: MATE family efflux transporter, partial [Oscillospiraceae bacterium]|nr:MATE family efflux transporter [Oscillospiraceae bacterium]
MFDRRQIIKLLIPLMLEQVLSGLMGIADTMMVTSVGETAISAVSLVDSINMLVFNLLAALAAGGVIVCAQFLGRGDRDNANAAARQVFLVSLGLSAAIMAVCLAFRRGLLGLIFGTVEQAVMDQAAQYFLITALAYPFVAVQQTAAATFRAGGNSAPPMAVAAVANGVNVAGNAILIFVFDLGVVGAALATTVSRVVSAVVLLALLRNSRLPISLRNYRSIRVNRKLIGMVLRVGVPTGVENSMFQLGKLVVQSTVSMLGTAAMAVQAMTATLELVASMPSQAIGIGLLTVAGQCMGAGRPDEARRYTKLFCLISEAVLVVMSAVAVALTPLVTRLSGMAPENAAFTLRLMIFIA